METPQPNETADPTPLQERRPPWWLRLLPVGLVLVALVMYTGAAGLGVAFGLVAMLVWHGVGHVHAARRVGLPGRRLFVLPFVPGVEALEALGRTRREQMVVAFGGPLYGLHLCGVAYLAGLVVEAGGFFRQTLLLWAGLNLLNMLPLHPFDGGRVAHVLASRVHPFAGIVVAGLGAAFTSAIALFFLLNTAVAFFGIALGFLAGMAVHEFLREYRMYQRLRELAAATPGDDTEPLPEDEALRRLFGSGALSTREAWLYLALYVVLGGLYWSLFIVARYSPALEGAFPWDL